MNSGLLQRYENWIHGVLGCFDRMVVTGTLTEIAHPTAMAGRLFAEGVRCFDIGKFADPLRQRIRANAERVAAEAQSDFKTVVEGTRVKHVLGRQSIKMYDKFSRVLRIEATSNDITFFRHYRKVVGRDGRGQYKMASLKKSIYSLSDVVNLLEAACRRYLDFAGTLEDRSPARHDLNKVSRTVRDSNERTWRSFNFFHEEDQKVLLAMLRGEFAINGLSNSRLRSILRDKSSGQISRMIKRMRMHGLIKKVGNTYRYY